MHLHLDWKEITFCQAESLNGFESCETALAAGVCHGRDSDGVFGVIHDRFEAKVNVVLVIDSNRKFYEGLWAGWLFAPSVAFFLVDVVIGGDAAHCS